MAKRLQRGRGWASATACHEMYVCKDAPEMGRPIAAASMRTLQNDFVYAELGGAEPSPPGGGRATRTARRPGPQAAARNHLWGPKLYITGLARKPGPLNGGAEPNSGIYS